MTTPRPLSLEEITQQAGDFEFTPTRPLKSWLRSANLLLTEATNCQQDSDYQKAYLYLLRHAELVLGKLPTHPDYKDPAFKRDIDQAILTVQRNFQKLEEWKPRIVEKYDRYLKVVERRRQARSSGERLRLDDGRRHGSVDGMFEEGGQVLSASENRQLAVDLAHREIRRRDATKQSTRQAGISPGTVAVRRRGIVVEDEVEEGVGLGIVGDGVRDAGRLLHHPTQRQSRNDASHSEPYHYPSVPAKERPMDWRGTSQPTDWRTPSIPPRLPSKAPSLPSKDLLPETAPPLPSKQPASPKYTFTPTAFTESHRPLRPIFLPPDLRTTFLRLAQKNTTANLETCAILCGTLISSALFINHLILPDQHSTSDTCDTTEAGDNALFDYCDDKGLLVCGWIHTHPTQTCFLSSRDLHTSAGYQVMLPEAIAIVCAPRSDPEWGVFRLTDPPGLQSVLRCEKKGLFHPHDEGNLYTDAARPGHVVEGEGLRFEVVDMRGRV